MNARLNALLVVSLALLSPRMLLSQDGLDLRDVDKLLAHHNRGVALMERFEPGSAVAEFRAVVALAPRWHPGRVNLAIALLNTQVRRDLEECEERLRALQRDFPDRPHGFYTLGMLLLHRGDVAAAKTQFEMVARLDPNDAHTVYQLGSIARQEKRLDDAAALFRRVLDLSPGFASAYYGLGRLEIQKGNRAEGRRLLARFRELETSRVGVTIAMKYSDMGPYADVIRLERIAPPAPAPAGAAGLELRRRPGGLGAQVTALPPAPGGSTGEAAAEGLGPALAAGDVDGDGRPDFLVATAAAGADRLIESHDGGWREVALPTSAFTATCAALGDWDGDGDLDALLAGSDGAALLKRSADGSFTDVTTTSGIDTRGANPAAAIFADFDHDGDLDLFIATLGESASGAPDRLYVNRGDGTFEDQAPALGLAAPARSRAALASDLDGDGTLDLLVGVDGGPNRFFRNGRALLFREHAGPAGLADEGPAVGLVASDLDGDGIPEVVVSRGSSAAPLLHRSRDGLRFETSLLLPPGSVGALAACSADFDNDGALDLLLAVDLGEGLVAPRLFRGDGRGALTPVAVDAAWGIDELRASRVIASTDVDANGAVDLVLAGHGAPPVVLESRPPAGSHWLSIRLEGKQKKGESFSNRRGIGARVEVKSGDRWTVRECGVGGAPEELHVGVGPREKIDYVRVLWPDGTLQSEMEVNPDQRLTIEQVVRKSSSCPLLFAWDGERFSFVTDFLGTGGLGFLLAPGRWAAPDPSEDIRLPPGALRERGGRLELRLLEPLEEVCYLDSARLLAIDHPAGTELYPEERFGGELPAPAGRMVLVREKLLPRRVTDRDGRDVTELFLEVDRRWPSLPPEHRFIGFVEEHSWTIELDRDALAADGEWFLFLDGWVEYTYAHVNYAAHQAGLALRPPSLDVPDGAGGWRTVVVDLGYPAGLPRTMVVPLPEPARRAGVLRLRTNMEIFWDRVFAARDVADEASVRSRSLDPSRAELDLYGFPREYSPDGREPPLYDYERKDPGVYFRSIPGDYTRLGNVRELLEQDDDRFVIFGRGDELALEFDARQLESPAPDTERTYVLRTFGYCKDRDYYTAHAEAVEPLPFRGMSGYPYGPDERYPDDTAHREYRALWNTRRVLAR